MLYARFAEQVLNVHAATGMMEVLEPTVFSQASMYDDASSMAHTRPMSEKQYPETPPMSAMRMDAGSTAEGALAKAAIPAGRESTPAPTMLLIRLKISLDMVAVPPDTDAPS